jgi:hypothetical protein
MSKKMADAKRFKMSIVYYGTGILISFKFSRLNIQKETDILSSQQGQKTIETIGNDENIETLKTMKTLKTLKRFFEN